MTEVNAVEHVDMFCILGRSLCRCLELIAQIGIVFDDDTQID